MTLFGFEKPIIGMIHVNALPGTPKYNGDVKQIIKRSLREAETYIDNFIPVLMIENMHDTPYLNRNVGPEITSILSIILYEIKQKFNVPIGIQILAGANKEAIASAYCSGSDFIRAEGFVFSHIADEGMFNSDAGELLRYRKQINAENIKIFTDIKKKHSSHAITKDVDITETAKAAEFFMSDGVIITGGSTGKEPNLEEIISVKNSVALPVLAGSGITATNIKTYKQYCDAFIIGSYFKKEGYWQNDLDENRIKEFLKNYNS
ncbi:MAG TPA: BtpA/SgcQ family protein [Melioribacteraceae bacterium]|nr:BtpA/SgcQ family protein [Melioribacteraceae bacterium]